MHPVLDDQLARDRSAVTLTGRDRALLRAVAAGRCDIVPTGVPALRVDGRWFCDQPGAHALLAAGLLARATTGDRHAPAAALLTRAGRAALDGAAEVARPATAAA